MTILLEKEPKECPFCHSKFIVFSDVWNRNVCGECGKSIEKGNKNDI